jgi:hypothetical protein
MSAPDGVAFEDMAIQPTNTNIHPTQLIPEGTVRPATPEAGAYTPAHFSST